MNRTVRKILCWLVMLGVLATTVARGNLYASAYIGQAVECPANDLKCQSEAFMASWHDTSQWVSLSMDAFQEFAGYLSQRFNVSVRFDYNGYNVLKSLFPSLMKLIERDVARQYGLSLPLAFGSQKLEPIAIVAILLSAGSLALAFTRWFDEQVNQEYIDSHIRDLTALGWPIELARVEANYQWQTGLAAVLAHNSLIATGLPGIARDVKILASRDYYNAWAFIHHDQVVHMIEAELLRRRRSDPNPDWDRDLLDPSHRCRYRIFVPGHYEYPNTGDDHHDEVIWVTGKWICIVG